MSMKANSDPTSQSHNILKFKYIKGVI